MSLSSDLLSEFAKITNDKTKTKSEVTVYGTVSIKDGKPYVKLDGSDLLTPVLTTVDVVEGNRVSVLFKNHTATVTGNLSSPAARTETVNLVIQDVEGMAKYLEDIVTNEQLAVEQNRITALENADVTINNEINSLKTTVGGMSDLRSLITGLSERVTALEERVKKLEEA